MRCLTLMLAFLALAAPSLRADAPAAPSAALAVSARERDCFQLGYTLGRAAFAYAELAKRAAIVQKTRSKLAQVGQLGDLAPVARQNRAAARDGFAQAVPLMRALAAPEDALAPVTRATDALAKSLPVRGDARTVSLFNREAGRTLAALSEFQTLSDVPEDPHIQKWLTASPSARVWYTEGLMTALVETAGQQQMPELLPPPKEIATDLRGLRDWLSLRLPDTPTADQSSLIQSVDDFLAQVVVKGRPQTAPLSKIQLQTLGEISRRLQGEIVPAPPVRREESRPAAS